MISTQFKRVSSKIKRIAHRRLHGKIRIITETGNIIFKNINTYNPSPDIVPIYWWDDRPNFGDEIGPYLINKITKRPVINIRNIPNACGIMTVGSIIQNTDRNNISIWGSGLISDNQSIIRNLINYTPISGKITALRGKRTAQILKERLSWPIPNIYGDPALLMPCFYQPTVRNETNNKIVICPHYQHKKYFTTFTHKDTYVTDVSLGVEKIIDDIANSNVCISTSLHGLIIAQAYRIPWVWLRISNDRLFGDFFKFEDFFTTIKRQHVASFNITSNDLRNKNFDPIAATKLARLPDVNYHTDDLLDAFFQLYH